jgi:hypothetical protein
MQRWMTAAVASALFVCAWPATLLAIIPFYNEFRAVYVQENKDKEFVKSVTDAKCHICHVGKKRTDRNVYGEQLAKLLDKTKDKANKKKIREALEKVAAMPSDPKNEESPTFGELIHAGDLPGGAVQKDEPKRED